MKRSQQNIRDLVWALARTDFKLRYHGSVLGLFWALLKPLFIFAVLSIIFSHFFASEVPHYSLQLLTGIVLWTFFQEGTTIGLQSMLGKAHILTKINFPRWVIIVAASLQSLMSFLINLLILIAAFVITGVSLSLAQILLLLMYGAIVYVLILAFSFCAAPLFVRFRDLNQIWEVLLIGGFYTAPIIYPLSMVPESLQFWLYLNPMTFIVQHAKNVLFLDTFVRLDHHLIYGGLALLCLIFGRLFFLTFEKKTIELL